MNQLNINVVITEPDGEEVEEFIDLRLAIRTQAFDPTAFTVALAGAIGEFMAQYGDVYELEDPDEDSTGRSTSPSRNGH